MRYFSAVILIAIPLPLFVLSCGSSSDSVACKSVSDTAVHENTLASNKGLCASFDVVIISTLEPAAGYHEGDTGVAGQDIIPINIDAEENLEFAIDDSTGSGHYAQLLDQRHQVALTIESGAPAYATVAEGSYYLKLHNTGADSLLIFIRREDASVASRTAQAMSDSSKTILITTGSCERCDLSGANLSNLNLNGVNLFMSWLNNTNLSWSYLQSADLSQTQMREANLSHATLISASFRNAAITRSNFSNARAGSVNFMNVSGEGAIFNGTDLAQASFVEANLESCNLRSTNLSGADFTNANMQKCDLTSAAGTSDTIFTSADLSGATWHDGTTCGDGSVGMCVK